MNTKLFDNVIILKTILWTTSSIIHFSVEQKFCKHHFLGILKLRTAKKNSGVRKVFRKIMQQKYFKEIYLSCAMIQKCIII